MAPHIPSRRIHLTAVGSPAVNDLARLGIRSAGNLVALASEAVAGRYRVTAAGPLIFATEDNRRGGRDDDDRRVREIERTLADDDVAALVTIRGGGWFARLLDAIDWDVLLRRRRTIFLFGFSEMTPLVAIAGRYRRAVGLYDLGPAFLYGGIKRYAKLHVAALGASTTYPESRVAPASRRCGSSTPAASSADHQEGFAAGWAAAKYPQAFREFLAEVADVLDGKGSPRVPQGDLLAGRLPARQTIAITGGNLSLVLAMVGSKHAAAIDPRGKWLALEDLNEPADVLDRMLAGLKLAGLFERAEGIILGDFHNGDTDLSEAVYRALRYHLPPRRRLPIVRLANFGHVYPIAPLPLHRPVTLRRTSRRGDKTGVKIEIPWGKWT